MFVICSCIVDGDDEVGAGGDADVEDDDGGGANDVDGDDSVGAGEDDDDDDCEGEDDDVLFDCAPVISSSSLLSSFSSSSLNP